MPALLQKKVRREERKKEKGGSALLYVEFVVPDLRFLDLICVGGT